MRKKRHLSRREDGERAGEKGNKDSIEAVFVGIDISMG